MKDTAPDDRTLLNRCFTGDRQAPEVLVRRFSGLVYHAVKQTMLAKHVHFDDQDLEDLHNTVFLNLFEKQYRKLRQYRGENGCSLATWIRVVTVRIILNHLRKKGHDSIAWRKQKINIDDLHGLSAGGVEPWCALDNAEQTRLVNEGIENLSPRDRLFMKLHFGHDLTLEEVAESMQISVKHLYTVKHRAIQRLKAYVSSIETQAD